MMVSQLLRDAIAVAEVENDAVVATRVRVVLADVLIALGRVPEAVPLLKAVLQAEPPVDADDLLDLELARAAELLAIAEAQA